MSKRPQYAKYTPALMAQMRSLWDEGYPTGEIAFRVGLSRHQVIGKANRAGFPPRQSPLGKFNPHQRVPFARFKAMEALCLAMSAYLASHDPDGRLPDDTAVIEAIDNTGGTGVVVTAGMIRAAKERT